MLGQAIHPYQLLGQTDDNEVLPRTQVQVQKPKPSLTSISLGKRVKIETNIDVLLSYLRLCREKLNLTRDSLVRFFIPAC